MNFDFKRVRLDTADVEGAHHPAARGDQPSTSSCTSALGDYIQRLVAATRPYNPEIDWHVHSPSELVERGVDLGASPRAIICWGRLAKVWALLVRRRDRGLSGRHPGSGALHPRPPHLARPARGEPWSDHRRGDRRHRRAGADPMRTREHWAGDEARRRAARQPVRHHRDRAAHPEADARVHDRRSPQPVSRARDSTSSGCATGRPATGSRPSTGRSRR